MPFFQKEGIKWISVLSFNALVLKEGGRKSFSQFHYVSPGVGRLGPGPGGDPGAARGRRSGRRGRGQLDGGCGGPLRVDGRGGRRRRRNRLRGVRTQELYLS